MPWVGALVHGVQVEGGLQLGLAAGQEHDACSSTRNNLSMLTGTAPAVHSTSCVAPTESPVADHTCTARRRWSIWGLLLGDSSAVWMSEVVRISEMSQSELFCTFHPCPETPIAESKLGSALVGRASILAMRTLPQVLTTLRFGMV